MSRTLRIREAAPPDDGNLRPAPAVVGDPPTRDPSKPEGRAKMMRWYSYERHD